MDDRSLPHLLLRRKGSAGPEWEDLKAEGGGTKRLSLEAQCKMLLCRPSHLLPPQVRIKQDKCQ